MNKGIIITVIMMTTLLVYFSSCYNNKEDIVSLPRVSFLGEVVPIMTSGGCGCHNNVNANDTSPTKRNAYPFTVFDTIRDAANNILQINRTIFYDGIVARVDTFRQWVNGIIGHPGGGSVDFTPGQRAIVKAWIQQGPPYDGGGGACAVSSNIRYTTDILPIYNTVCKSSGCHGGRGPVLDYSKLRSDVNILTTMMNSAGSSGHPGGVIGLSSCVVSKFKAWIAAGQPN
jgi:hypothetical protein